MAKTLEALQKMPAAKQERPTRCSSTCMIGTAIILIP